MAKIHVAWLFRNWRDLGKALKQLENNIVFQHGLCDEENLDYDLPSVESSQMFWTIHKHNNADSPPPHSEEFLVLEGTCQWEDMEALHNDYWMSPVPFEHVDTFDWDGKNLKGECVTFGAFNPDASIPTDVLRAMNKETNT